MSVSNENLNFILNAVMIARAAFQNIKDIFFNFYILFNVLSYETFGW